MNKSDLISQISTDAGITKAQAQTALNSIIEATSQALINKENVTLIGFGTFSVIEKGERTGRNPQTGKEIKIAAKNVVKFKPGKELSQAID